MPFLNTCPITRGHVPLPRKMVQQLTSQFPPPSFSLVSKYLIFTVMYQTKVCGPLLMAKCNSDNSSPVKWNGPNIGCCMGQFKTSPSVCRQSLNTYLWYFEILVRMKNSIIVSIPTVSPRSILPFATVFKISQLSDWACVQNSFCRVDTDS
jgi:hypothetical protein